MPRGFFSFRWAFPCLDFAAFLVQVHCFLSVKKAQTSYMGKILLGCRERHRNLEPKIDKEVGVQSRRIFILFIRRTNGVAFSKGI
ncbi:hypothetical protein CPC08DRAFT_705484 [Agrocybe pediades]|nr:hypothetical protein CPC08DRAFT_705484 [Agrocybe pediades]